MKPRCYNRPPFKHYVTVPCGWNLVGGLMTKTILDEMSKTCQQHGATGEATLHPDDWDCAGCQWKPSKKRMKRND